MILNTSPTAGVLELTIPKPECIPSCITNDPSVASNAFKVFYSPISAVLDFTADETYVVVPLALVPANIEAILSQPVIFTGMAVIQSRLDRIVLHIEVETIEYEACGHLLQLTWGSSVGTGPEALTKTDGRPRYIITVCSDSIPVTVHLGWPEANPMAMWRFIRTAGGSPQCMSTTFCPSGNLADFYPSSIWCRVVYK